MNSNIDNVFTFSLYDPFDGEVSFLSDGFEHVAKRARKILINRTREQIYNAAEIYNWINSHETLSDYRWEKLGKKAIAIDEGKSTKEFDEHHYWTETDDLVYASSSFDISNYDEFPNAKWEELFAVMSLGFIADALDNYNHSVGQNDPQFEASFIENFAYYLLGAMDAVCTAEQIQMKNQLENDIEIKTNESVKEKLRLNGQKGAIKKNAQTNALKKECFHYYLKLKNEGISKRQAAHDFYEYLPTERKRLLAPTNAIRTLAEGITNFEKRHVFD